MPFLSWAARGFADPSRVLWFGGAVLALAGWGLRAYATARQTDRRLLDVVAPTRLGRRPWLLLAAWSALAFVVAGAAGVGPRAWYASLLPPGLLCTMLGLDAVLRWPRGRCTRAKWVACAFGGAAACAFLWFLAHRACLAA